ncbi:hypothetical protein ELQ17_10450 [Campylobacter sp. US18a]|nr:hypothetical protein ELQ17_10450 [Campylobacter sp. US18a]
MLQIIVPIFLNLQSQILVLELIVLGKLYIFWAIYLSHRYNTYGKSFWAKNGVFNLGFGTFCCEYYL